MSITPNLRFHLEGLDSPVEAWKMFNIVFGLKNKIQAYLLENELITLGPNNFSYIENFLPKFRTLRFFLEGCKVKKVDDGLVYGNLSKLEPIYSTFVSTFHSTREALIIEGTTYTTPSFDAFYDSLIREQETLLYLALI